MVTLTARLEGRRATPSTRDKASLASASDAADRSAPECNSSPLRTTISGLSGSRSGRCKGVSAAYARNVRLCRASTSPRVHEISRTYGSRSEDVFGAMASVAVPHLGLLPFAITFLSCSSERRTGVDGRDGRRATVSARRIDSLLGRDNPRNNYRNTRPQSTG